MDLVSFHFRQSILSYCHLYNKHKKSTQKKTKYKKEDRWKGKKLRARKQNKEKVQEN